MASKSWAVNSHDACTPVDGETRDDEGAVKVKSSSSGFHPTGFIQHFSSDNSGSTVNRLVQYVCDESENWARLAFAGAVMCVSGSSTQASRPRLFLEMNRTKSRCLAANDHLVYTRQ